MATVACKLPNGLTIDHKDETLTLNGAHDQGAKNGYGLTELDDGQALWFKDWLTGDGREFPAVERKLIFRAVSSARASDQAGEQRGEKSGLEGLDPNKPAPGIEATPETKAELAKGPARKK